MGIKNYIGELQVNSSPVVTEDTIEEKAGLTDYVKFTDEPASVMTADGKAGPIKLNETSKCGLYLATQTGKGKYLSVYGPDTTAITRRNGNYPLVISALDKYLNYAISGKRSYSENGVWKETLGHQIALNNNEKISAHKWLGVPTVLENFDINYDHYTSEQWSVTIRGYNNGVMYLASPVPYPPEALIDSTLAYKNSSSTTDTRPITESMIVHKNENGYTIQYDEAYMFVAYNDQYVPDISNSNCYSPKAGVYFIHYDNGDPCEVSRITNAKKITIDNDALDLENNSVIKDIISAIPTNVSQLANDSNYLTEHQSLEGLATEGYVDHKVKLFHATLDPVTTQYIKDSGDFTYADILATENCKIEATLGNIKIILNKEAVRNIEPNDIAGRYVEFSALLRNGPTTAKVFLFVYDPDNLPTDPDSVAILENWGDSQYCGAAMQHIVIGEFLDNDIAAGRNNTINAPSTKAAGDYTDSQCGVIMDYMQTTFAQNIMALVADTYGPHIIYDDPTGFEANDKDVGNWQLTGLDLTPYKRVKFYIKAAESGSTGSPSHIVEIHLDDRAKNAQGHFTGGHTAIFPDADSKFHNVSCSVSSDKTAVGFNRCHRYSASTSATSLGGRCCYLIEGYKI